MERLQTPTTSLLHQSTEARFKDMQTHHQKTVDLFVKAAAPGPLYGVIQPSPSQSEVDLLTSSSPSTLSFGRVIELTQIHNPLYH